jgi:hypothetical protein
VSSSHHSVEFVDRDSHHQVVPHDAAAHSPPTEEGKPAEHLSFAEVRPIAQRMADAIREPLVVRHDNRGVGY